MRYLKGVACVFSLITAFLYAGEAGARGKVLTKHQVEVNGTVIDVTVSDLPAPGEPSAGKASRKWIIKFTGPVYPEQRFALQKLGCRLHDYLPDFAFLATMDDAVKKAVSQLPYIDGVARFKPDYKLSEKLRKPATSAGEKIAIQMKLDEGASLPQVMASVHRMKGEILDVGRDTLRVAVGAADIATLATLEEVTWIHDFHEMRLLNDTSRWTIQSYTPGNTKIWNKGIHGEGQILGVGDTGLDHDMPWFDDATGVAIGSSHRKVAGYDTSYGDDYDADDPGHGTHVAGTVAGDRTPVDGGSDANGMAFKSRLFIQDLTPGAGSRIYPPDDLGMLFTKAYQAGARLHTNSWGSSSNSYDLFSASADRYVWDHKDFLPIFANGNSGPGVGTVGSPATAKNVISVGASYNGSSAENVASFSSNGPAADGRVKPTLTAPGVSIVSADSDGIKGSHNSGKISMSGTSMATPTLAGAAALVRQYFTDGYARNVGISEGANPSAALIKAVLLNCAQSMSGTDSDGPIPSTGQGWGRINLSNALVFPEDALSLQVADQAQGVGTGNSWSRDLYLAEGQPLKVTLVWSDYPGATGASKALVNDLDLTVTAPGGATYKGNAFSGGASVTGGSADRLNVEEQVLVKAPVAGVYQVKVTGYNVPYGPQPFALVATGAMRNSKGTLTVDRRFYTSHGLVSIRLADQDLVGKQEQAVKVTSATEASGETVTLAESASNSGIFTGELQLASGGDSGADGVLQTGNGETITVVYQDANDGTGRAVTTTATAKVDDVPPVLSAIAVSGITDTGAKISWSSNEPANSVVGFGETPALGGTVTDNALVTDHSVFLKGLKEGASYYVALHSADEAGNGGDGTSNFATQSLPPYLSASSSEGTATYRDTTIISGVSTDPSGVASVTINGTQVTPRTSDGYYSLPVNLQLGDNLFTVTAADKLNNKTSVTLTVARLQQPDLYLKTLSGPASAAQDGSAQISDSVCNKGPGSADRFLVGFYLSADQSFSSDDTLIGSRSLSTLAAGACDAATTTVSLPSALPGAVLYLIGYADYAQALPEADESNNTLTGNTITMPAQRLPAPASITAPESNTTGSIYVFWSATGVAGATYILEYSRDNGAWTAAYSGATNSATVPVSANGSYVFRVRAVKTGYTDSAGTLSRACAVTLTCGAPAAVTAPGSNSTGSVYVFWSTGNVAGVSYLLEYSRDNGAWTTAYSGTANSATVTVPANGIYTFRVKATKSGYADSAGTVSKPCSVTLTCAAPSTVTAPSSNTTGSVYVFWSLSNVTGVTYVLEYSRDGGAWSTGYSGTTNSATVAVSANGIYTFRVKATKTGFADSASTASKPCPVTLTCGAPATVTAPASDSTGKVYVFWSLSNVSGVSYVLEYSRDGGAWTPAYSGTTNSATVPVSGNGSYLFRVKATKSGYADSGSTVSRACAVTLVCGAPATVSAPASSSTGSIYVYWSVSNVAGVTYVLDYSSNNATWTTAYSGPSNSANVRLSASGVYTFRVRATKAGYADSSGTLSRTCTVTLGSAAAAAY